MTLLINGQIQEDQHVQIRSFDVLTMITAIPQTQEPMLYVYRLASADMKYIEINIREIYLRQDPLKGPILRGELPKCGPSCHADLSEIFLEYAMSCRCYKNASAMPDSVVQFGERLGEQVAAIFLGRYADSPAQDIVPIIFDCVLESMGVQYQKVAKAEEYHVAFQDPPLSATAGKSGLQLYASPASQGFLAFCASILKAAGGEWTMLSPSLLNGEDSLQTICLKKTA